MFYIEKEGNIVLFNEDKAKLENSLKFMPQYKGLEIKETDRPIENFEWADTEEYIAKKQRQELESQVAELEGKTGLSRIIREIALGNEMVLSPYVQEKIREIETLAVALRAKEEEENE